MHADRSACLKVNSCPESAGCSLKCLREWQNVVFVEASEGGRPFVLLLETCLYLLRRWSPVFAISLLEISRDAVASVVLSCCCSVSQLCLTLCNPMDCSTPGFPVSLSPGVGSNSCPLSLMLSNHLILCHASKFCQFCHVHMSILSKSWFRDPNEIDPHSVWINLMEDGVTRGTWSYNSSCLLGSVIFTPSTLSGHLF